MDRLLRGLGTALVTAGAVGLLYAVYLGWFTGLGTAREQEALAERWQDVVGTAAPDVGAPGPTSSAPTVGPADDGAGPQGPALPRVPPGDLVATLRFERDGRAVVTDGPLYVVEGVGVADLRRGPGRYPGSAAPGGPGNFAIAGHRTTYGAPFAAIDRLRPGDTVLVEDRGGRTLRYTVRETRVVGPDDGWVLGPDPLGIGRPTLTLTTCHPRYSAEQRLIVWGELVGTDGPGGDA